MFEKEIANQIRREQLLWAERNSAAFTTERKKEFTTEEGIPIKRVYTPVDLAERGIEYIKDIGFPGEYPFTRGIYPTMYRSEEWMRRQSVGFASLEESNRFWKKLISLGLNRIWVNCDLPTQTGYDSDDPLVKEEVGKTGIPLSSLKDWEIAFDGIDIAKFPLEVQANALASFTIACHLSLAEKQGIDLTQLRGFAQHDILKEYAARGLYRFPPGPSMKLVTDVLIYCAQNAPKFKSIVQVSAVFRDKGANRVHEVAFGMSCAIAYLEAALRRGADIDNVAPQIAWNIKSSHVGFLEEIAKIRAARKVWARIVKERFGAKNPASMMLSTETKNQGNYLTKEEPLNNIARSAIGVLASALAGVQEQNVMTPGEALGIPNQESSIFGLRINEIVASETGITNTADPLAGSYCIESLTSDYEERIMKEIEQIDQLGGMLSAIEKGYVQRVIQKDAGERLRAIESGDTPLVGFNKWRRSGDEEALRQQFELLKPYRRTSEERENRIRQAQEFKKSRDSTLVQRKLDEVRKVAKEWENPKSNLMVPIVEAVKAYATIGEISGVFQEVFGSHRVSPPVWKKKTMEKLTERPIKVIIAKVGLDGHDAGVLLVLDELRKAGMEVIYTGLHATPEEVVGMAIEDDVDVIGISLLSDTHMDVCSRVLELLGKRGAKDISVVLGGLIPDEDIPALKEMGVSAVLAGGTPLATIVEFVRELGLKRKKGVIV